MEYQCDSFEDFLEQLDLVKSKIEEETDTTDYVKYLYRGHADSNWLLQTTLERETDINYTRLSYTEELLELCFGADHLTYFQSMKEKNGFSKQDCVTAIKEADKDESLGFFFTPYHSKNKFLSNLWVEARQYGYPSPLLDWTLNSNIALWFAFSKCFSRSVAIYLFEDSNRGGDKSGSSSEINIYTHNPIGCDDIYRNFIQKARYTICTLHGNKANRHIFASHIEGFEESRKTKGSLHKFVIQSSEKLKVMDYLRGQGIDYNSLFKI